MDLVREFSSGWMLVLAAVIVRSVLVLVVAGMGYLIIRRLRPAVRAAWLQSAIAAVALLPLLSVAMPQWSLDVLPPTAESTASVTPEPVDAERVFPAEWVPGSAARPAWGIGPLEPSREVGAPGAGEEADAGAPRYETSPRVAEADAIRRDRTVPSASSSNVISTVVAQWAQSGRGWTAAALAVYFAGVAVCLASLACKLWSLRRWRKGCVRICDQRVLSRLDMWCKRLGVRRSVRAVTHERVGVPTTFGWLRATVVLQGALFEPGNEALLDAALVHELAHIRRGDLWWTLFDLFVAAFYWPNPFVWWALRRLVALRELACDDWCASVLERPAEYSANLKEIAIMARRGMMTGLNASMARRPDILNRLVRLETMRFLPNPRLRWRHWAAVAAATLAVCAGCASGRLGTRKSAAQAPAVQSAPDKAALQTVQPQPAAAVVSEPVTAQAQPSGTLQSAAGAVIEADPSTLEAVLAGTVEPGTVILLADGEYAGQYRLLLRGTEAAPVKITARGKSAVIGGGSAITLSGAQWVEIEGITCNRMEIFDSANCRVAKCIFDGQGASCRVTVERSRRIAIEDCEIANGKQHGLRVYGGCEHVAIRRNYIHDNGACAMTIIPLQDGDRNPGRFLTIEGNRVARNCTARPGAAINLGNVRDCTVVNNLLYRNAYGGIAFIKAETDSANERAIVAGNIIYTGIEKGLYSFRLEEACSDFVVKNNIFWGGSDGAVNVGQDCLTNLDMDYNMIGNDAGRLLLGKKAPTGEGTVYTVEQWQNERKLDAHSLFQTGPGFVSVENDDYRPAPDSPAVDRAADLSGILAGDIDGTPRPLGKGFDIGCYEYGAKGEAALAEAARPKASPEKLMLTVLEKQTGAPVSAAMVDVSVGPETWQGKTDDAGRFVIDLSAGSLGRIGVKVSKAGLASARLSWDAPAPGKIPKDYTLRMIKAVSIGGAVKDLAGQPVPGVLVTVGVPGVSTAESFALADEKFETDDSGVWQCDAMPSGERVVAVAYTHRDYVMADGSQAADEASLLRRTALALMRPKLRLEGVVVNDAGEGVLAVVTLDSADRVYQAYPNSARCARDGRFLFDDAAVSAQAMIVTADGYAPYVGNVSITKEMPPVKIVLAEGSTLRGHVLASDGTPVPDASVSIMKWREPQSLPWSTKTDSSGYFEWTSAPPDAVTVSVRKDGYRSSVAELSASQPDNKVILLAPPRLTGTVTDAETGQKIASFAVVCGELPENWGRINWNLQSPTQGSGGSYLIEKPFDTNYGEPVLEYHVRAEAKGYKSAEKSVKLGEGDVVCDFALEKGASIVAKARRSDGTPAKGARAVLSAENQVSIYNAQLDRRNYSTCELDDSGEFWFVLDKRPFAVAIVADSEYAVVSDKDLDASNEVTLKPFGRIEGQITQLSKPNIGREVSLEQAGSYPYDQPGIRWSFNATAGGDGKFVFEKVPAGVWLLARSMDEQGEGGGFYSRHIETLRLQLADGQTARVTVSDPGRTVTGRVALGDSSAVNLRESFATFGPYIPDEAVPKDVRRDDPQSFSDWWHKWGETPEGRKFWMGKRSFWSKINPDGGFNFENVPPGKYDVTVNIYTVSGGGYGGQVSTSKTVEVAEAKEGESEVLDAGVLRTALLSPVKAGDDIPDFTVAAIDGREVKSSDFAGRHLVLYFWSSRNRASRAGMKVLNQLWDECGKDDRLAILGVNSDDQADAVRQFAAETQVNWPQAAGGACAGVAKNLGVAGLPAAVVVGPDGKVTLVTASASEVADAVRTALGTAK